MSKTESTSKSSKQLEALAFGLGLRISQAKQVAQYWVMGRTYFDVPARQSPNSGFDFELFELFRTRVVLAFRITSELQNNLTKSKATKLEISAVGELQDNCKKLCDWRPWATSKEWTYDQQIHQEQVILPYESRRDAEQLLEQTEVVALKKIRVVAKHRDSPFLQTWLRLGRVASDCFDERDTEAPAEEWPGLEPLQFSGGEHFSPETKKPEKVKRLADRLSVPQEEIGPSSWNPHDPVQKWIIDEQTIPDIFPGWFPPEVMFRKRCSVSPVRDCYQRDHTFLSWKESLTPSELSVVNKHIRERWNRLPEAERQKICPKCFGEAKNDQTVKKGIEKAEIERDLKSLKPFDY